MLNRVNPTTTKSWNQLSDHQKQMQQIDIQHFFSENPQRFLDFSIQVDGLLFDFSKNRINKETLNLLIALAQECKLPDCIESMFTGANINETENRSVLHTALRNQSNQSVLVEGKDIMPDISQVLEQMRDFCDKIHSCPIRIKASLRFL